jgi:hypothetical protein
VIGKIVVGIHGGAYCVSEHVDQPAQPAQWPAGASAWDTRDAIIPAGSLVKQNDTV